MMSCRAVAQAPGSSIWCPAEPLDGIMTWKNRPVRIRVVPSGEWMLAGSSGLYQRCASSAVPWIYFGAWLDCIIFGITRRDVHPCGALLVTYVYGLSRV